MRSRFALALALLVCAGSMTAATFVVPSDEELVAKAQGIVTGVVEGSFTQEVNGTIETIYEIRAERGYKGVFRRGELVRVVAIGGIIGDRGLLAPGEAHYRQGERVLVFLTRDGRGRWRTTDLTLGRFVFRTSTAGERLLVRDMEDVVGWDHAGRPHEETLRREEGFLRFVEERARGRAATDSDEYMVRASEVTLAPQEEEQFSTSANATSYPPATYTSFVNNQPVRWPNLSAGIAVYKRADQSISGAADGGVSVIQGGLGAWTNECGSLIVLNYAGEIAKASANHDGTNVVEFNDPQERISGSWSGSGTIGIAFLSFAGTHQFAGASWLNITDMDVVFQNGYTATHAAFPAAMTHEIGHGLGWRHSNQNHATGGACNSAVEECTSAAIMNSSVNANYGFTLQPWDVNAAQSVYPGGTCGTPCTPPSITSQPQSTSITSGTSVTLSVAASGTTPLSYQWYVGSSGNTGTPVAGATGASLTVNPNATTSYWVRVTNACGSADSATATVTVTAACTLPSITSQPQPVTIARGQTATLSVAASGSGLSYQWYAGPVVGGGLPVTAGTGASVNVTPAGTTTYWVRVSNACGAVSSNLVRVTVTNATLLAVSGDHNLDGRSDILWRNVSTGENAIWLMDGFVLTAGSFILSERAPWTIAGRGDFNGDGRSDILWRNTQTGENAIWLMNGFTLLAGGYILAERDLGWEVAGIGDFNGDGRSDILWRHRNSGANAIWLMSGFTLLQGSYILTESLAFRVAGVADFNGDRRSDILWRNTQTGDNAMWLMNGFTIQGGSYITPERDLAFQVAGVGDYDANGTADIVWRHTRSGANAIWLMNGFTLVAGSYILTESLSWSVVGTGDYNGDGNADLFWRSSGGENAIWLMNRFAIAQGGYIRSESPAWTPIR